MQLFSWWYGPGWKQAAAGVQARLTGVSHMFSVPILLRTLWSPWRRIVTNAGSGIDAKIRALGDNMVSRAIGFTVRLLVLITAGCMLLLTALAGLVFVVIWPLIPLLIIACLVKGAIG